MFAFCRSTAHTVVTIPATLFRALPLFYPPCGSGCCHLTAPFSAVPWWQCPGFVVSISSPFLCAPVVCCRAFVVSISALFFLSVHSSLLSLYLPSFPVLSVSVPWIYCQHICPIARRSTVSAYCPCFWQMPCPCFGFCVTFLPLFPCSWWCFGRKRIHVRVSLLTMFCG